MDTYAVKTAPIELYYIILYYNPYGLHQRPWGRTCFETVFS